jgi:hypothetical protein
LRWRKPTRLNLLQAFTQSPALSTNPCVFNLLFVGSEPLGGFLRCRGLPAPRDLLTDFSSPLWPALFFALRKLQPSRHRHCNRCVTPRPNPRSNAADGHARRGIAGRVTCALQCASSSKLIVAGDVLEIEGSRKGRRARIAIVVNRLVAKAVNLLGALVRTRKWSI